MIHTTFPASTMVQNLANIGITNQYGSQFVNGLFNNFDEELNKISETNDKIFYILDFLTSNYFKKLNQQIKYEFIIKLVDNLDNPLLEMIFEEITLMNDNIITENDILKRFYDEIQKKTS